MQIKGFTLIELMVVIAIVGILAGFAYPSYMDSVTRSRRADGKVALLNLAQRIERYYSENNTYANVAASVGGSPQNSPEGFYTLSIQVPNPATGNGYLVSAIPQNGQQQADTACQSFTYTHQGIESIAPGPSGIPTSTAALCWSR